MRNVKISTLAIAYHTNCICGHYSIMYKIKYMICRFDSAVHNVETYGTFIVCDHVFYIYRDMYVLFDKVFELQHTESQQ